MAFKAKVNEPRFGLGIQRLRLLFVTDGRKHIQGPSEKMGLSLGTVHGQRDLFLFFPFSFPVLLFSFSADNFGIAERHR